MAQQQGDHYLLGATPFFKRGHILPRTVEKFPDGSLGLGLRLSHPIPAPADLTRPATAAKRIDLHIFNLWAGLVIEGDEQFFFGPDRVTVNTHALRNADSYRAFGGMVADPGTTADIFPGRWVYDPTGGNGQAGNYAPGDNGWTNFELLVPTGYGVFPQGSSADAFFHLDPASNGGPIEIQLVLLADWADPRAGTAKAEQQANRLPDPSDPQALRYILPFGAGDLQKVGTTVLAELPDNPDTSTICSVSVVDFDADSGVAPVFPNNNDLSDVPFASGISEVVASFPDLDANVLTGVESAGSGNGHVDNEKVYEITLANNRSAPEGTYRGLIRIEDEESANLDSEPYFQLDPSLVPLSSFTPLTVWQMAEVTVFHQVIDPGEPKRIVFHNEATDPSFRLGFTFNGNPATHEIGGLTVDDTTGIPMYAFAGKGLAGDPNLYGRGIRTIQRDAGGGIIAPGIALFNPAGPFAPAARSQRLVAYVVSEAYVDQTSYVVPRPSATGMWGWSDLATLFLLGEQVAAGRSLYSRVDDFEGFINDNAVWYQNHEGNTLYLRPSSQTNAAPEYGEPEPEVAALHQGLLVGLVDIDFVRPGPPRTGTRDDLVTVQGLKGLYNPNVIAETTETQVYTIIDYNDPNTPAVEPWGEYGWVGPTSNSHYLPAMAGTGIAKINIATTVDCDADPTADRFYVADSLDNNIEMYQSVPPNVQYLLDGNPMVEHWVYQGVTTAAGQLDGPIDITVTGDGAGSALVMVIDRNGEGGNLRLSALDPTDLSVLATRDLILNLDITGGANSIAADESLLNIAGDPTASVLLWNDSVNLDGGMNWYTVEDVEP